MSPEVRQRLKDAFFWTVVGMWVIDLALGAVNDLRRIFS